MLERSAARTAAELTRRRRSIRRGIMNQLAQLAPYYAKRVQSLSIAVLNSSSEVIGVTSLIGRVNSTKVARALSGATFGVSISGSETAFLHYVNTWASKHNAESYDDAYLRSLGTNARTGNYSAGVSILLTDTLASDVETDVIWNVKPCTAFTLTHVTPAQLVAASMVELSVHETLERAAVRDCGLDERGWPVLDDDTELDTLLCARHTLWPHDRTDMSLRVLVQFDGGETLVMADSTI